MYYLKGFESINKIVCPSLEKRLHQKIVRDSYIVYIIVSRSANVFQGIRYSWKMKKVLALITNLIPFLTDLRLLRSAVAEGKLVTGSSRRLDRWSSVRSNLCWPSSDRLWPTSGWCNLWFCSSRRLSSLACTRIRFFLTQLTLILSLIRNKKTHERSVREAEKKCLYH